MKKEELEKRLNQLRKAYNEARTETVVSKNNLKVSLAAENEIKGRMDQVVEILNAIVKSEKEAEAKGEGKAVPAATGKVVSEEEAKKANNADMDKALGKEPVVSNVDFNKPTTNGFVPAGAMPQQVAAQGPNA